MKIEEIIEEIKKDEKSMYQYTSSATFLSLYLKLVEKGILTKKDIEDMNKKTEELTEGLIVKTAKQLLEEFKEEK